MTATRFDYAGRDVAVTGAAIGIGAATARAFADHGARVWLMDIDDERSAAVTAAIVASGGTATSLHVDVTSAESVGGGFTAIERDAGKLDVLVNNAGGFSQQLDPVETAEDEWDHVIDLNLKGVFLCARAAIPLMRIAGSGRIINLGSMAGQTAMFRSSPPYAAAKAGVHALSRVLAYELGPEGITSNAIAPSAILTDRILEVRGPEERARTQESIPVKRYGTPEDVAAMILYVASDEASYLNGQTISVNGGRFMT